jgi:DNA-binding XRE family transcriptional regulator
MAEDPSEAFRHRLRMLRKSLHLSQEQLAERAGLNYKHYQEIERGGKTEVRFSTLVKLARAFSVPLHELFWDELPSWQVGEAPAAYQETPPRTPRPLRKRKK